MTNLKTFKYNLGDIVYYIVSNYKWNSPLSNARLTKIVFLTDWNFCLKEWKQATWINWYFDSYGPYVNDVISFVESSEHLSKKYSMTMFWWYKTEIKVIKKREDFDIPEKLSKSINFVMDETSKFNFNDFIDFVYSLYPIQISEKFTYLNLPLMAHDYKKI